jgi:hypothetical protein
LTAEIGFAYLVLISPVYTSHKDSIAAASSVIPFPCIVEKSQINKSELLGNQVTIFFSDFFENDL